MSTPNSISYTKVAIKVLKDVGIVLSKEEKEQLRRLKTEEAVDRAKRGYINAFFAQDGEED